MPKVSKPLDGRFQLHVAYLRLLPSLLTTFIDRPSRAYRLAKELLRSGIADSENPSHHTILEFWCKDHLNYIPTNDELQRFDTTQFAYYYREVPYWEYLHYHDRMSMREERCPYVSKPPVLVNGKEVDILPYDVHKFASKLKPREFWHLFWKERRILLNICHPHIHEFCGSFSIKDYAEYYFIFAKYDSTLEDVLGPSGGSGSESSQLPSKATSLIQWMLDLTSALAYLHGLGAFHRYVCPRTIVF